MEVKFDVMYVNPPVNKHDECSEEKKEERSLQKFQVLAYKVL